MSAQKPQQEYEGRMLRILSTDIAANKSLYSGLTKIKGISWSLANSICHVLKMDKNKKVGSLTKEEIGTISEFIKNLQVPGFLKNRNNDFGTGEDKHLIGSDLELQNSFDIKRLKKIKSYRGFRHMAGLPSRGQRTKANFRRNRKKGTGIKKKKK